MKARIRAVVEFVSQRPALALWAAGLALAGVLLYYLVSALIMPDMSANFGQPQITMNKVQGRGERGTQLGWTFVADSSETSTDGMVTTYHRVREAVYYVKGRPAYKLSADQVTLDSRTMNYTGTGSVHVWSVRPRDLSDVRTENVSWNNPLQTISFPSEVHVKYKGYEMVTSHLEANLLTGSSTLGHTSIKGNA